MSVRPNDHVFRVVHGQAAADQRVAHRGRNEDDGLEHACGVAAGRRFQCGCAQAVGEDAGRRRTRARGHRSHGDAPRDCRRAVHVRGALRIDMEASRAEFVHRVDRPRMADQVQRAARPDRHRGRRAARVESASMIRRTIVLSAVLSCIGLPPLFVLINAASFYSANRLTETTGTIVTSAGQTREYILYVPKSYDRTKPSPLVISMHGAENWPSFQMNLSQWNQLADERGFIVVYPAGEGGGPKTWHMRGEGTRMPDVIFISELIDKLEASYNIDPARIYANGVSNGGGMAFVLSCTMSDRIAAVGMVGAAQTLPWSWCTERRGVPMIAFHGTADRFAFYNGGQSWVAPALFPAVPLWTANWARRNRCGSNPLESAVAPDVTRREYTHCADDAAVVLYIVWGGGHTWPGGGPLPVWFVGSDSRSIDSAASMWAFF